MKKIILIFVIFSLNICYSQWEKTNWRSDPEIEEVFANENYIIIEGSRQLFASADFGKTWQKINIELPESHRIKSVVFIDNNIYLGDNMGNIFVSEDFGNSVTKINDGMQAKFIIGLYSDNGLLYGHASKTYIYMSDDLGLTWDSMQVVPDQWIRKIAVNGKIIVANTSNGLYISTNSGKTWQKRENGIESTRDISQIDNIHFSDNNIIISTDSRRSYYDSMALYSSSDYGVTWVKRGGDLLKSGRKNSVVASSGIVYLASANELYYSNDTCKTWTATNGKLPFNYGFHSIACYKDSVYVAMGGELYSSYKDGANWQLKKTGQKYGGVTAMSVVGDRLLIGAGYGWMNESKFNIFSSSDYGSTWTIKSPQLSYHTSFANSNNLVVVGSDDVGVLISIDSGKAFQYSDTPDSLFRKSSIATLAVMDTNIFVCLGSEFNSKSHIFISSNYGKTWVENTSGLDGIYVRTLKVNNNFLIAGTSNGVYFSSNMGESWSRKNSGIPDNTLITSIEVSGEHIVATSEKMVYVSADMGENWQASNNGFPQNSNILQSIVINDKIFICNANYGVYMSSDFGLNWVSKNDGLENLFATNFAKLGDFLFVSTLGTGSTRNNDAIYKAKIIDLLSDIDEKQEINTNIFYPNPATDFININIDISGIGLAQIYNIYGSEIMQYNLKTTNSGIDISALVPGVYYLRIGSKVAKLIKM